MTNLKKKNDLERVEESTLIRLTIGAMQSEKVNFTL